MNTTPREENKTNNVPLRRWNHTHKKENLNRLEITYLHKRNKRFGYIILGQINHIPPICNKSRRRRRNGLQKS